MSTATKDASAATKDIQADLHALQADVARLTRQLGNIAAAKGNAAWKHAKSNVNGVFSDAQAKGADAMDTVRDASGDFIEAIEDSIHNRPYTTLAVAIGIGFVVGAIWRR